MTETTYPWQNTSLQDLPGEIWKPIDGYKDCYEISNLGRVKSLGRTVTGKNGCIRILKDRIRKNVVGTVHESKAVEIMLSKDNKLFHTTVARLMALAFIGTPADKNVCFRDNDSLNVNLNNLRCYV